ncbi:MAG: multi-component transcriptional regulator, winged helix family [Gemmatimonadetes bacterium]|nr:multi-component transcriptional regulator, winged helix family [Gemmatimonadota bacterium]
MHCTVPYIALMKNANIAAEHASMHRALPVDLFTGLLAIAADAVIALDHEQRIIFFNQGAERIFGWAAAEVGGKFIEVLLPERYRSAHRGHVAGFGAAHGHARLMGDRQQISGLRKSGEEFAAEAAIERIEVDGRNIYAAVLRDISARQRAEDALRQAVQGRDDMMGIVSHDLRNPANAVKMLARSILEGDPAASVADVMDRVAIIRQAADQIDALIQDLLDVTRLEAGYLTVRPTPADVGLIVTTSIESLGPLAEAGGVALSATLPDAPLVVLADRDRLGQLLSNLIGNAIKFTPAGGRVTIAVIPRDTDVEFEITDTGEGIAPDQLPHVFDRFHQASASRRGSRHSAGLGLPISRGIVEAHGGRIWLESESGTGTTVRFTLPRSAPAF